jgi:hypothetical protein
MTSGGRCWVLRKSAVDGGRINGVSRKFVEIQADDDI